VTSVKLADRIGAHAVLGRFRLHECFGFVGAEIIQNRSYTSYRTYSAYEKSLSKSKAS
jgi:hypothetical protein